MPYFPRGATVTVILTVAREGRRISSAIETKPETNDAMKRRLMEALGLEFVASLPSGEYAVERTLRGGSRLVRAPAEAGGEVTARIVDELLVPMNELVGSLVKMLCELPTAETALEWMREAYAAVFDRLFDEGEVAGIRPGRVRMHFSAAPSGLERVASVAVEEQLPHVRLTLARAKRDIVLVKRTHRYYVYFALRSDACPFHQFHRSMAEDVLREAAEQAEAMEAHRLFRRLVEQAARFTHAKRCLDQAFGFNDGPLETVPATVYQNKGEPGEA